MRVLIFFAGAVLAASVWPTTQAGGRANVAPRLELPERLADDEGSDDEGSDEATALVVRFEQDPTFASGTVVSGQPLERLSWADDEPAWAGDAPGSLTGTYDSNLPAGLFGFPLPTIYDASDTFTAAAAFVIRGEGFEASPSGFFQISWGLWNTAATGIDRTGSVESSAADTFELIGFDWFANVSPFFGGPFLSPIVFGTADLNDPAFEGAGAFANLTSVFDLEVDLPRDVPLFAVMEHRPALDGLAVQVYRILDGGSLLPLDGAVGVVPLALLDPRAYAVDAVGLMLWNDGFGGPTPALVADVTYHALVVVPGIAARPEQLLGVEP